MSSVSSGTILPTAIGTGLLSAYFLLVLLPFRLRYVAFIVTVCFIGIYWLVKYLYNRRIVSETRLKDAATVSIATLLSIISVDIGYTAYLDYTSKSTGQPLSGEYLQKSDGNLNGSRLIPPVFYPTEKNYFIFKPNVTMSGDGYGSFYNADLKKSPTIYASVLELRHLIYSIDEHGFREDTPLEQARIFTLGDSFTFGHGTSQIKNWVELLEVSTGGSIYNLGIPATSPKQQLMLLRSILQEKKGTIKLQHLLWMIFEGNDLVESYQSESPVELQRKRKFATIFEGTIVSALGSFAGKLKKQSVANRLMTGRVNLGLPSMHAGSTNPYMIDGIQLKQPLYFSEKFGHRLFRDSYVKAANMSESFVTGHANRPLFEKTLEDMMSLSREYRFKVTVLIAPTAPRLHGPEFPEIAHVTDEPHFIDYVENISRDMGFDTINLHDLMQPYARNELLYWRDDDHWNERGQQVVAEIIGKHVFNQ